MNRAIELVLFMTFGVLLGGGASVLQTPKVPRDLNVKTAVKKPTGDGGVQIAVTNQNEVSQVIPDTPLTVFREQEWIEVPASLIKLSNGFSMLTILAIPSVTEMKGITSGIEDTLKMTESERTSLDKTLNDTVHRWVALQLGSARRTGTATWRLAARPEALQSLLRQMEGTLQNAIGPERTYVFKCMASRSLGFMFDEPELQLRYEKENELIKITGGEAGLGLGFSTSDVREGSSLAELASFVRR